MGSILIVRRQGRYPKEVRKKKDANLLGEASLDDGHHTKAPTGGFVIGHYPVRYPKEVQWEKRHANLMGEASQDKDTHRKAPAGAILVGPGHVRYPKEVQ